ncbi:hypothetical protein [Streptomyces tateyamensis]|uniref:hypothetical protein n=1 Tax=Streptomyces tateyamensis TaxID=565073 RepID=UPI0011B3EEBA|nr:hypothetical protein [Streptomyces tateyamensis]
MRPRFIGLAAAVSALAIGGAAAPAQAADPVLKLTAAGFVAVDPAANPNDHSGDTYLVLDLNTDTVGPNTSWAVLTIDTSEITGIATVQDNNHSCTAAGTVLTCAQVPLYQGHGQLDLPLLAVKDAKPGATGTVHYSAHFMSGNTAPATADTKVMLGGTRLTGQPVPTNKDLKPGDVWKPDLVVTNKGDLTAPQLVYTFTSVTGLDFTPRFSNCEYGTSPDGDAVICTVHSPLAPGETAKLDPVGFTVNSSAYDAYEDISVSPQNPGPGSWVRSHYTFTPGPAASPRLTVGKPEATPAPGDVTDLNPNGGGISLQAQVKNTADFAAFGAWAPEAGGKQGKLTVGMTSSGPAAIFWRSGSDPANVALTLPKQAKVLQTPDKCRLDNQFKSDTQVRYSCQTSPWIAAGYRASYDFTLQVDPAAGSTALVTLPSLDEGEQETGMPWDPNKANNAATVALGTQASGSVPTSSPTTPPPAPRPAPSASTSAPAATKAPASTASAVAPASSGSTPAGKGLASTGAQGLGTITGVGLAVLAIGAGTVFTVRRRKAGAHS